VAIEKLKIEGLKIVSSFSRWGLLSQSRASVKPAQFELGPDDTGSPDSAQKVLRASFGANPLRSSK
jgi:hypothetical protein